MNWNEYEKMMLNQIADAKHNRNIVEKEYKQAKSKLDSLLLQYQSFKKAINEKIGD
jgi:hypothetical protein